MLFLKRLSDQFDENVIRVTEELVKDGMPEVKAQEIALSDPIEHGGSFFVPLAPAGPNLKRSPLI